MYKFDKFPEEINENEYLIQENIFISYIKEDNNIVSLYSVGELELFGVSDLDYLIIFKGEIDKKKILDFRKKYFLIDTILFINISELENINYISHHFNYKLIYGKNLNLKFNINNKNLNIIYAWKICFFSLLRNFYYYKFNNKILVKNLLSQINDIRYPIFFLKNLGINREEYDIFIKEFSYYRSKYFNHNNFEELSIFLEKAITLSWKIIFDLSKYLPQEKKINYMYGRFPTIFKNFNDEKSYIKESEKLLKYIGKFSRFLYLPIGFNYKNWDGDLNNDFKKILKNNPDFLNFDLNGFLLNIILCIKKIIDFIILRLFIIYERKK